MTRDEILRSVLVPLADEFEAGNRRGSLDPASIEYPSVRDYVTMLIAEGSVAEFMIASRGTGMYQLTNEGYEKYKSQIAALRASTPRRSKS
jgi:predicted transcriptional regulator